MNNYMNCMNILIDINMNILIDINNNLYLNLYNQKIRGRPFCRTHRPGAPWWPFWISQVLREGILKGEKLILQKLMQVSTSFQTLSTISDSLMAILDFAGGGVVQAGVSAPGSTALSWNCWGRKYNLKLKGTLYENSMILF